MNRRLILFLPICFLAFQFLNGQGIRDSVFSIREVRVEAESVFESELAGLKELRLDSQLLASHSHDELSRLLSESTGLFIKDYGRGALSTIAFRGTAPSHTKLSWNGIPLNSPMLGMSDLSLIPVSIFDNITIKHGAASIANLAGALGGEIELENQVDWNSNFRGSYIQALGSYSSFDEFLQLKYRLGKIQSKTSAYHSSSRNDYPFRNRNLPGKPMQRNRDAGYSQYGFTQELYSRLSDIHVLSARLWFQNSERSIPAVLSQAVVEGRPMNSNKQVDQSLRGVFESRRYGSRIKTIIRSGFDFQSLDYSVMARIQGSEPQFLVNSGSEMSGWFNHIRAEINPLENLNLKAGLNYNYFSIQTLDSIRGTGYTRDRHEPGLFAGVGFTPADRLDFSLQMRTESPGKQKPVLIYSTGLRYKLLKNEEFFVSGSVSRNYHFPGINDMFWQPGGNPDLLAEKAQAFEASAEYSVERSNFTIKTQATIYHSDIANWILWLPGTRGYWQATNIERVESQGMEIFLQGSWVGEVLSVYASANYLYSKSINKDPGENLNLRAYDRQLPHIPLHSGNLSFRTEYRNFGLAYRYNGYGKRYLLSSNEAGLMDNSRELGLPETGGSMLSLYPHHLNQLAFSAGFELWKLDSHAEFRVNNLFNESYRNILQRFMPGRNYELLLRIDF